jgi:uncharacterized protein YndB with AHSA1/START domain
MTRAERFPLSITRELFVPRELIFDVWTQPEHLVCWYSPGPDFERRAEVDLESAGSYSLWWIGRDGRAHRQSGEFEVAEAPERLIYSARYDEDGR